MLKLIRLLNTLSFDTAFGAASFVFVIAYSQAVTINVSIYGALIISVLLIYNMDHLLDANKLKNTSAVSYRHKFYQKHFEALVFWQFILAFVGVIMAYFLPKTVLLAGVGMALLIGVYFIFIFKSAPANYIFREVVVAIGYTAAVAIVPFVSSNIFMELSYYGIISIVFFIALSNLWVFAIYDVVVDERQNQHSIARSIEISKLFKWVRAIILFSFSLIIYYSYVSQFWVLGLSLLLVEATYFMLLLKQYLFRKGEGYRLVGEIVLVLPGFLILMYNAI